MIKLLIWYVLCLTIYFVASSFLVEGINLTIKAAILSLVGVLLFKKKSHLWGMLYTSAIPVPNFLIYELALSGLDLKMLMWQLFVINMIFYQLFAALIWPVLWLIEKLLPSGKDG